MPAFHTRRRVEFCDTDMAGIVHFANFFRYMESAEVDFLQSLGISVRLEWEGQMIGLPRVSASCDYLRPARFEDILDITVRLVHLGQKSLRYVHEFACRGTPIAVGRIAAVCCRVNEEHQLESIHLPASLRELLLPHVSLQDE